MANFFNINKKIFQWDINAYLTVDTARMLDEDGTYYAHFCRSDNQYDIKSVAISNKKALIPNDLVQMPGTLWVFGYFMNDDQSVTMVSQQFSIFARPKPPEYISDPTPVITYPELVDLVDDLTNLRDALQSLSATAESVPYEQGVAVLVTKTDTGFVFDFQIPEGKAGIGITSIDKTGSAGLVDTYTITFSDGSTTTFTVTNGEDAVVDPTLSHVGEAADAKATGDALAAKVDKVAGKGLSTNDFTHHAKEQTDFVYEHFGELDSLIYLTSGGNADDIVIEAQRDIVLNPAQAEDGSVYKGSAKEENELMTRADLDNELSEAVYNLPVESGIATGSLQQKREAETFEVFDNDNIRNNTDIDKDENGEVITGARGEYSTSLGKSQAKGKRSVAEGVETVALGRYSHAEGNQTFTKEPDAHAEGVVTSALGFASHSEGSHTEAQGSEAHSEGTNTIAKANSSHAQNRHSHAKGIASHAEGFYTVTGIKDSGGSGEDPDPGPSPTPDPDEQAYDAEYGGYASHAEGYATNASARASHSEGYYTKATGQDSHAEGGETTASGLRSHAEGERTTASGEASHAEGQDTFALGPCNHSEGKDTTASGYYSHAEGRGSSATGEGGSHAEGLYTIARGRGQHAAGRYNVANEYLLRITGNGQDDNNRSNAEALDDLGNLYLKKDVYVNCNADSSGGQKLAENLKDAGAGGIVQTGLTSADDPKWSEPTSSANGAIALGRGSTASGDFSFAQGKEVIASGGGAVAFGKDNEASGNNAFVTGLRSKANAAGAAVFGTDNTVTGAQGFTSGSANNVSANHGAAIGVGLRNTNHPYMLVVGSYNAEAAASTPDYFEVGGGTEAKRQTVFAAGNDNGTSYIRVGSNKITASQAGLLQKALVVMPNVFFDRNSYNTIISQLTRKLSASSSDNVVASIDMTASNPLYDLLDQTHTSNDNMLTLVKLEDSVGATTGEVILFKYDYIPPDVEVSASKQFISSDQIYNPDALSWTYRIVVEQTRVIMFATKHTFVA